MTHSTRSHKLSEGLFKSTMAAATVPQSTQLRALNAWVHSGIRKLFEIQSTSNENEILRIPEEISEIESLSIVGVVS